MKVRTVRAKRLGKSTQLRLDAHYFLSPGVKASETLEEARLNGTETVPLGEMGSVWAPSIFKRVYAAPGEDSVPYLRPYDVFDYLPTDNSQLSSSRTKKLDQYRLSRGTILQTCSGRNLGPLAIVDSYTEQFVLSHDMIRIDIKDEEIRHFVIAYLKSPTGQQLLRRDKSGSVIDHITTDHVSALDVPQLPSDVRSQAARAVGRAFHLREQARTALQTAREGYEASLPSPSREQAAWRGWTRTRKTLGDRLDAAFYDPLVDSIKIALLEAGGKLVSDVAKVVKPQGRYKTNYVDEEYGRPLLSGGYLLQEQPVNLKYMAPRAFKDVRAYELKEGWIAYPADGRAEQALGTPVLITARREGWLASGHVGRVIPNEGVDSGWLYLALSTWLAQTQIKSKCSGSVVDSTFPWDMEGVVLPPPDGVDGAMVREAWSMFDTAEAAENEAVAIIERALEQAAGLT